MMDQPSFLVSRPVFGPPSGVPELKEAFRRKAVDLRGRRPDCDPGFEKYAAFQRLFREELRRSR